MADLSDIQASQSVKLAGADPSTGIESNWMGVDSSGRPTVKAQLYDAAGSAINLGQAVMASSIPVVLASNQSAIPVTQSGTWTVTAAENKNYGTVGATTLRTAAQIGNATGAANFNYGTVGAQTLRAAAQIGNATGAADFNAGTTGAQTLRTVANQGAPNTAANGWFQRITDGTDSAKVTTNSDLSVSDGLRNGGVHGALTLTTGGTTYEAKVGGSRLANRKSMTITADDDMFWGYSNTVTTATGTPLKKNQQIVFSIDPDSTFQVWLVASSNNKTARITESP
ncbi:MAG: hypothetical protein HC840_00320 [Leptolyngbyaceae cyanobacterium RM2_2_4]|nr:hypothetical protein [Leptolyngbyaceae cyanobacterium RM2_2_4]